MSAAELGITDQNSYLRFLGLDRNPFPLVPDVNNFFFSHKTNMVLNELIHGIHVRKGFLMLTGEVGLGKTTIVHMLLRNLAEKSIETSLVFNTYENDSEFFDKVLKDFNINFNNKTLAEKIDSLHHFLLNKNIEGKNCVIFVDDAQNLSYENIEILRMISNLETSSQKLVQIVLVGQPELKEKFEQKKLRQIKSRIMIDVEMRPLTENDLKCYLIHKTSIYNKRLIFAKESFRVIHSLTGGNLRKVNKLLDRCLYAAIAKNTCTINNDILLLAASELKFSSVLSVLFQYKKIILCSFSMFFIFFTLFILVGY